MKHKQHQQMKAQDLKVGSTIEIESFTTDENGTMIVTKVIVPVERCSDTFVWFKYMGLERTARTTIDKNPNTFKIISI